MTFILSLSTLVAGALIGYLIGKMQGQRQATALQTELGRFKAEAELTTNLCQTIKTEAATREQRLQADYAAQLSALRTQHQEQLNSQMTLLKEQMTNACERMLHERSAQLGADNKQQMDVILTPLRQGIGELRAAVEKSDRTHTTTMERLDATIRTSMQTTSEVGQMADRLAEALTADNKQQGDFGELKLQTLLEDLGLEEGIQFEQQVTLTDKAGHTLHSEDSGSGMRLDAILHFPDHRDLIIDSKVSLKAYMDYLEASDEEARSMALRRHIDSIKAHVKGLARKDYSRYYASRGKTLDFVVMYVFHEGALQLALATDATLWKEAYDNGVIICGSQNLYALLRVLEFSWRQQQQSDNQEAIMKCANELVNRAQLFMERFAAVQVSLSKTQDAFDALGNICKDSGRSIPIAAANLLRYGAKENPKRKASLPTPTNEMLPTEPDLPADTDE